MSEEITEPGMGNPDNSSLPETQKPTEVSPQSSTWLDKLSPDMRKLAEGKGLKGTDEDLEKAFKSYSELEKSASAKVSVPKDDDNEGMDKLMRKLGKPESPEGYVFSGETKEEKALYDEFRQFAFNHHLPLKTAEALVAFEKDLGERIAKERAAKQDADFEQIQIEGEKKVRDEWGISFAKNTELASRGEKTLASLFGEDGAKLIKDVLPRYAFLNGTKNLGQSISEDNILSLEGSKPALSTAQEPKAFMQNLFNKS